VSTERGLQARAERRGTTDPNGERWDAPAPPRLTRRRFALHGSTTSDLTLLDEIAAARRAGFDAIEVDYEKLVEHQARGGELEEIRETLARLGVDAVSLFGPSDRTDMLAWRDQGARERWGAFCARAAAIGCTYVIVRPGVEGDRDGIPVGGRPAALGAMADVAAEFALRAALEFQGGRGSAAPTLAAARALVDGAGTEVRLVIDAFHFHAGGSTWAMLEGLPAASIALVRLVDDDARAPETLTDVDRLLPGDGVIPLRDLVRRVEALGADVVYSVNLHVSAANGRDPRGYARWGAERLTTVARESAEALCAEVDEQDGRLDYA
jgi:2-keto-myo-inositol isomerase